MDKGIYGKYSLSSPAYTAKRIGLRALLDSRRYAKGILLDIGCGSREKERLFPECRYVGLDHVASGHDVPPDVLATACSIPIRDGACDTILSTAVLEHLEEPGTAVREAWRVLKPGGWAIYTVPLFWHLHEEPRDFYRYTEHGLRYLFESAGFEEIEIIPQSGFWTTASSIWNYYLQRFRRSILKYPVDSVVAFNNLFFPGLDRGFLRDERFTWMYLVRARKPLL